MQVRAQENLLVLLTFLQNLKWRGIDCEYVSEYAKDRVWQGDQFVLQHCQLYVTGKQCLKIARLIGKVDVIITDSPIAIGAIYTDEQPYKDVCIHEASSLDGISLFSAVNPKDHNVHEFMAYVLTSLREKKASKRCALRIMIHLDSYKHLSR